MQILTFFVNEEPPKRILAYRRYYFGHGRKKKNYCGVTIKYLLIEQIRQDGIGKKTKKPRAFYHTKNRNTAYRHRVKLERLCHQTKQIPDEGN